MFFTHSFFLHFVDFLPQKKHWIIMLLYVNDIEMSECLYVHGCEVKKQC
jgi:hypothetical protein